MLRSTTAMLALWLTACTTAPASPLDVLPGRSADGHRLERAPELHEGWNETDVGRSLVEAGLVLEASARVLPGQRVRFGEVEAFGGAPVAELASRLTGCDPPRPDRDVQCHGLVLERDGRGGLAGVRVNRVCTASAQSAFLGVTREAVDEGLPAVALTFSFCGRPDLEARAAPLLVRVGELEASGTAWRVDRRADVRVVLPRMPLAREWSIRAVDALPSRSPSPALTADDLLEIAP